MDVGLIQFETDDETLPKFRVQTDNLIYAFPAPVFSSI
jgi:hypothetical protein